MSANNVGLSDVNVIVDKLKIGIDCASCSSSGREPLKNRPMKAAGSCCSPIINRMTFKTARITVFMNCATYTNIGKAKWAVVS